MKNLLPTLFFLATSFTLHAQTIDIKGPEGTDYFGTHLYVLQNGNYVVVDPSYDSDSVSNVGALFLYNGRTHALISKLTGSHRDDFRLWDGLSYVYYDIYILPNSSNFIVFNYFWDNGYIGDAGAITFINGDIGLNGVISASNSLIGSNYDDMEPWGDYGTPPLEPVFLSNDNYIISNPYWDNGVLEDAGAVTWCSGTNGCVGVIGESNSMVGNQDGQELWASSLNSGNYLVRSKYWDNGTIKDAGSITWCDGNIGRTGVVNASNSLVGDLPNDRLGSAIVTDLDNGHYVLNFVDWHDGYGAVTWCDGTTGRTGYIDATNSLIGSINGPYYDDNPPTSVATLIGNSNYVVVSQRWNELRGAITWCDGSTGRAGSIDGTNSIVGISREDFSAATVTPLANGHFLIATPYWDNGLIKDAGAVSWVNGTTGRVGALDSYNSLVGDHNNDRLGAAEYFTDSYGYPITKPGVISLPNSNYVIRSFFYNNNIGAATWVDVNTVITGTVNASNSLLGSGVANGPFSIYDIQPLANGNYVVVCRKNSTTWCDGNTGRAGYVDSTNSFVGNDNRQTVYPLSNGN